MQRDSQGTSTTASAATIDASSVRALTPAERKLVAARRLKAADAAPYLASLLLAMPVYAVDGITASVDRSARLYLGMDFFGSLPADEAVGVLLHEVHHIVQAHGDRADALAVTGHERPRWNTAADLTINDDLIEGGFALPDDAVCCEKLDVERGHTAEVYFDELGQRPADEAPLQEGASCGSGAGGPARPWELPPQPESDESGSPNAAQPAGDRPPADTDRALRDAGADDASESSDPGGASGSESADPEPDEPDASDVAQPADPEAPGAAASPDADFGYGLTGLDIDLARREVAEQIQGHISRHGKGSVPAGLRSWAQDQMAPPSVSWRELLRTAVREPLRRVAGVDDFTWSRPNRRRRSGNIVLPDTVGTEPTAVVVVDTSGSISEQETRRFVGELTAMVRQFRVHARDLMVVPCDTEAHPAVPADRVIAADVLPRGGGTDMRVGIEAALASRPRPDLVVVFTDGQTPWPDQDPRVPVVAVITRRGRTSPVPDWITAIEID